MSATWSPALFADIKGSTQLMEDLYPEQARAIADAVLQPMIEAGGRYDGYVVQSTGDPPSKPPANSLMRTDESSLYL